MQSAVVERGWNMHNIMGKQFGDLIGFARRQRLPSGSLEESKRLKVLIPLCQHLEDRVRSFSPRARHFTRVKSQ